MMGEKIRARRLELGLTQKQLAKGMCSPSLLSMAEAGRANVSHRTLVRLAERLKLSTQELLVERTSEAIARFGVGVVLLETGQWQEAMQLFLTITAEERLEISSYEWLYAQARCSWLSGQYEAALSQLEEAFERAVALHDERQMFGSVLLMGELEESRGQAEFAYYHYRRGERIRQRGRRIEAEEERRLYRALGRVALQVGRADEGLLWLEREQSCRACTG
jgi:HTH-type transcriptional regulator, quorum sensing regulator NprR